MKSQHCLICLILSTSSLHIVLTTSTSELYHITPLGNSPCSKQPCLTLEQFVTNVTKTVKSMTLVLLPGNHSLSSELTIANVQSVVMYSDDVDTLVICSEYARLTFTEIAEAKIKDLKFLGCGGNSIMLVKEFSLVNLTFAGNVNSTTALILNETSANITDTKFSNNVIGKHYQYTNADTGKNKEDHIHVKVGGAMFISHSKVSVSRSLFDGNSADNGGAIFTENNSIISISDSRFVNTRGTVIYAVGSSIDDEHSVYESNAANMGAVVYVLNGNISFSRSKFYSNRAESKGGVVFTYKSNLILDECEAHNNTAMNGGVIYILYGTLSITESNFTENTAIDVGGVMNVESCSNLSISGSSFNYNRACNLGILYLANTKLKISDASISHNDVNIKGVIHAQRSVIESTGKLDIKGNIGELSIVYLVICSATINNSINFENNSASFMVINSEVKFYGTNTFKYNNVIVHEPSSHRISWTLKEGGAVTGIQSTISFSGITTFEENFSENNGGALCAMESIVTLVDVRIMHNRVNDGGGGIYLYNSVLSCKGSVHVSENEAISSRGLGGGIHAVSSSIEVTKGEVVNETDYFDRNMSLITISKYYRRSELIFAGNNANLGGGLYLDGYSKLYILGDFIDIVFNDNAAQCGGAIFVNDNVTASICGSKSFTTHTASTECFLQKLHYNIDGYKSVHRYDKVPIQFNGNSATKTGSILYGGLLDRCTISPLYYDEYYDQYVKEGTITNPIEYFQTLGVYYNESETIASDPVRVCFCETLQHNCSYQPQTYEVMKGEEFTVALVAVDQVNVSIEATIHSSISSEGGLGEGQHAMKSGKACTDLTFSIKSPRDYEKLTIYAEGPCQSAGYSERFVIVNFKKCTCPIGFQSLNETNNCVCDCDPQLSPHATCDKIRESIKRNQNVWIGYCGYSNSTNQHEYLIYPNCPFDYCHPPTQNESIDLNISSGSDSQCAFGRSGLLCGSCQPGLTLSIGSSRCIKCTNSWPGVLLGILLYKVVFGIALVILIFVLDLTVAKGTINGLLFYANVVGSSNKVFLHFQKTNLLTMFINWLNVTIGFDACFIKGMDTLVKTWLELISSAYVFALVLVLILLSKYSSKFAQIFGKGNPVATLATLILLFYTKLLRNTIKIFSFAVLKYPNGSHQIVWRPDATIEYLGDAHTPLFLMGILIFTVVLAYTVLLFSWQWLQLTPNKKIFKWIRNSRLNLFMEANLAPYKPKYRFWTGLLLFVRILLHIVPASSTQLNLLAVGGSVTTLVIIKAYIGDRIYKQVILDYLEFTYYFNIILLTIVTSSYYLGQHINQEAAAYTSISLALITFLCILFYHIVHALRNTRCWTTVKVLITNRSRRQRYLDTDEDQYHLSLSFSQEIDTNSIDVTSSVVSISPQHQRIIVQDEEDESQCNTNNCTNSVDGGSSVQVPHTPYEEHKSNNLREPLLCNIPKMKY